MTLATAYNPGMCLLALTVILHQFEKGIMIMRLHFKRRLSMSLVLVSLLVVLSSASYVLAEDSEVLQQQTNALQNELDGINQEMVAVSDEIASLEMEQSLIQSEIMRLQDDLVVAQEEEDQQYEDMKTRIKFMYENGDATLLELLFSAEDLGDFLNKADFIQSISDYDREMLDELRTIREDISTKQEVLAGQQNDMATVQQELVAKQAELQQKAVETATDLEAFQAQLAAARAAETAALPTSGGIVDGTILHTNATEVAASDAELLAAIIECEAYQDYNSLLAVATVIMNRLEDPRFPDTIPEIIYATNQFEPVSRGMLDVVLARGASDLSRQVAQDALNGARLQAVSDCYFFLYAGATSHPGVNVGGNVFFQSW